MTLRKKIIFISLSATVLITGILTFVLISTVSAGFQRLQDNMVEENVSRIGNSLENYFSFLVAKSGDWAHWDESYKFIDDLNEKFIRENTVIDAFSTLDINFAVFINKNNKAVYSYAIDLNKKEEETVPPSLLEKFILLNKDFNNSENISNNQSGYLLIPDKPPVIFVAQKILKSDGSGPVNGTLIFGRYLDNTVIAELKKNTIFPLTLETLNHNLSPDFGAAYNDLQTNKKNIVIFRQKENISGFTVFKDFQKKPAFIFRITIPREIQQYGELTLNIVIGSVVIAEFLFGLIIFLFVDLFILRRLINLSNEVKLIHDNNYKKTKILSLGDDEISYLGQEVENMLSRLSLAQKDLEKFKLAVEIASDHILITDLSGHIIYANKAVTTITGYTSLEVLGKTPGQLWGGLMDKVFYENMWHTIKDLKQPFRGEFKNKRKNGKEYIAELYIAPILDEQGEVIFFVGIERDITTLKEIDKRKSEFISLASHQLRTPLTGIKWFSQLLLENSSEGLSPEQQEFIDGIYQNNERMISLVNDLLEVSHIETGNKFIIEKKAVNISLLIEDAIKKLMPIIKEKEIEIVYNPEISGEILVIVDQDKITEVLAQIIKNSIQYSLAQSKVYVDCNLTEKEIIISIKDRGIGIPSNQQARVFEKFFRGDNVVTIQTDGSGLELYITKAIVEAHGGKIWFESEENKGTTFFISLPL